jgi:hypothetical protein
MPKTCTFEWNDKSGQAQWSLAEDILLLMPESGPPLPFAVKEISGISGDGHSLDLRVPGAALKLSRLGQDGPTLLEHLQRTWPSVRADALGLTGTGTPARYRCRASSASGAKPAIALLFEDILLLAPEGEDLAPVFLPTVTSVELDEGTYAVALERRGAAPLVFTKLAGQTREFSDNLRAARGRLTAESLEMLSAWMPALSASQKASLAGSWPPGLLLSLQELESLCPGFKTLLDKGWMSQALRQAEGRALLAGTDPSQAFLGFARPPAGMAESSAGEEDMPEPETAQGGGAAGSLSETAAEQVPVLLWLLVRRGRSWLLESLTEKDHATYRFEGGDEMVGLGTALLCAPLFSREALYLAMENLTGDRADYAIAARDLGFLKELRARFKERVIHSGLESWKRKVLPSDEER